MSTVLETLDLGCTRAGRPLVSNLSFTLSAGELLHVVGSNGSGKTTLLRTLCSLSRRSAGDIRWHGISIDTLGDEYRRHLAYVGHSDALQGELSGEENLRVAAGLVGTVDSTAIDNALERVGLRNIADLPAKILSQGQKRRLALARLPLLAKPLWILDEPFSALDARSVRTLENLLAEHLHTGGMIVITSHQEHHWQAATVHRVDLDS